MKVYLFSEGMKWIEKSGLGRAIKHQQLALREVGITVVDNPEEADVIHVNTYLLKSRRLVHQWKKKGIPIVYHAHSTKEDFRNSFLFSNLFAPVFEKWIVAAYNQGDVVVTPTPYAKELLQASGVQKEIIPVSNGIDLRYYQRTNEMAVSFRKSFGYKEDTPVVMAVGLYLKRKGILDFVELAKRMPDVSFIWFGAMNLNTVPKEIREAVRTELPNLNFAGYVNPTQLREAYAGADVFFFPTYEETEGIVLLEAMAMEQTILIRDIPIYNEFQNKVDLYKGRSLEEFQQILEGILQKQLARLGEAARRNVAKKDLPYVGESLRKVYEKAIQMGKSPTL